MVSPACQLFLIYLISIANGNAVSPTESDAADRFTPQEPTTSPELFGQTIRASHFRTPAEEKSGFHLPDGFQVELVAAEPTISKPMNMSFDGLGRLWITQSSLYPFPAKQGEKGTDGVVVFEDKDKDGDFESSQLFADELNIPIGLLPYGTGALCFSIPNILYLQDTDGDGICDKRDVVLGPFDTTRDTHGMINSLRMGSEGWVYACHGFNNQSTVQGKDGHVVSMTSGNVFRFKPDGSRVELFTQGQVNPFGLAQDRWGFWYAADCHSKPISQLIRGGCYPSFGRPDDGLGFVPPMMDHLHGSTAISGLAHSKDSHFPQAFEENFLSGNVMTCRINRNQLTYNGATAKASAMPDLLTSDDPWFRPVDLQFGPDGCLYIADFYNKVIGHYEVPLEHPDRDRKSGRIWRIRWTGGGETIKSVARPSLNDPQGLFAGCAVNGEPVGTDPGKMESYLVASPGKDTLSAIREYYTYSMIAGSEQCDIGSLLKHTVRVGNSNDPVLYQSLLISTRQALLRLKQEKRELYQATLEKLLSNQSLLEAAGTNEFSIDSPYVRSLTRLLLSLKDNVATNAVLTLCQLQVDLPHSTDAQLKVLNENIQSIAVVIDENNMDAFLALLDSTTQDLDARGDQLLRIARNQMQQRGKVHGSLASRCRDMVSTYADSWLNHIGPSNLHSPLTHWSGRANNNDDRKDWPTEKRSFKQDISGANASGLFFSSLPLGEGYTGTWRSSPFLPNDELDFFVVGHNGLPSTPDLGKNYVSLVRLDEAGNVAEELYRESPPRSDIGKRVQWDLSKYLGATVQLRVVDGDPGDSYAWIGIGRCSRSGLNPGPNRDQWERILSILALFGFPDDANGSDNVGKLLQSDHADWTSRYRLHRLRGKSKHVEAVELVDFVVENNWADLLKIVDIETATAPTWDWNLAPESLLKFGDALCKRCSYQDQERLVSRLSRHRSAIGLIASLCERGALSRDALRVLPKGWWEGLPSESKDRLETLRPAASEASNRLNVVERKAAAIEKLPVDLQVGAKQFADRCASCHKLGDVGKVIGPQLEGVGARGILRLCEDILWPDRNVDEAFRMTIIVLDGGESANGLVTDRTAESFLLTDQTGKQRRIQVADMEQEKLSKLSLMPGNFEELMTDSELASLIGYLRANSARR